MTKQTQLEYFQEHAVDGVLSDAQMAVFLGLPQGDTPIEFADPAKAVKPDTSEEGGKPDAADATPADDTQAQAKKDEGQQPPAEGAKPDDKPQGEGEKTPVILAKDGVHTIEYQKLVDAREAEKAAREAADAAKAEAERLRQEVEALKKGAQPPAAKPGDPGTETDPANAGAKPGDTGDGKVDFGDYSDAAIAKAVAQLVTQATAPLQAELDALKGKAGEAEAKAQLTAQQEHYAAIYKAHADADSIAQSSELSAWIDKQPTFARDAYRNALAKGTTTEVIELFDTYKAATGKTGAADAAAGADKPGDKPAATPAPDKAAAAAQAAIDAAKAKPPTSLSEIPAGSTAHHDPAAAMLENSSTQLLDKFHGKSPAEIMRLMDKVL